MSLTAPPALPADPPTTPNRQTQTKEIFSAAADEAWEWLFGDNWDFIEALRDWYADDAKPELEALQADVTTKAGTATTQAGIATAAAATATAAAASATGAADVSGTSTTTRTPTVGSQTWVYVETGKVPYAGMRMRAVSRAALTTNYALGTVASYDAGTRTVTLTVDQVGAAPVSASDWNLLLEGEPGPAGEDAQYGMPFGADATGTLALTYSDSGGAHRLSGDTAITVDDPADLTNGWTHFIEALNGVGTVTADFSDGATVKTIPRGCCALLACDGGELTLAIFSRTDAFGAISAPAVLSAASSQSFVGSVALTATRGFVLRMNASGYPVVDLVDETGAVLGTSSALDGTNVVAGTKPKLCWVSASSALVLWKRLVSGLPMACMVSFSGTVVSSGTAVVLESVNAASVCGCVLSVTEAIVSWADASNTRGRAMGLDLTGNTIATNTIYNVLPSHEQQQAEMVRLSATQGQMVYQPGGGGATQLMGTTLTKAAGVLTFPATPQALAYFDTAQSPLIADTATAGRKVVVAGESYQGPCRAMVLDVTGTGTGALQRTGHEANVAPCGGYAGGHLVPVSEQHFLRSVQSAGLSSLSLSAIRLTGDCAYELPAACSVARKVDGHAVMVLGTTAVVTYADTDNSYYPTVRTVDLGTIT